MHPNFNGVQNGPGLLDTPSTRDLVTYSLKQAKAVAALLRKDTPPVRTAHPDAFQKHPHGGYFVALDFLSHAKSTEAANMLEGAGLIPHTHFSTSQIPSACSSPRQKGTRPGGRPPWAALAACCTHVHTHTSTCQPQAATSRPGGWPC